jgi:hypothetical protein
VKTTVLFSSGRGRVTGCLPAPPEVCGAASERNIAMVSTSFISRKYSESTCALVKLCLFCCLLTRPAWSAFQKRNVSYFLCLEAHGTFRNFREFREQCGWHRSGCVHSASARPQRVPLICRSKSVQGALAINRSQLWQPGACRDKIKASQST